MFEDVATNGRQRHTHVVGLDERGGGVAETGEGNSNSSIPLPLSP